MYKASFMPHVSMLLLPVLALFIAGCGGPQAGRNLTMYTYLDKSDRALSEDWDVMLDAFEKENPNIGLEIEYGYGNPYESRLEVLASTDKLPDILSIWPDRKSASITGTGKVKDLRGFLSGREKDFDQRAIAAQGPAGEIWVLPGRVYVSHLMFTNTRLLKELGLSQPGSLAELLSQGAKIRAKGLVPIAMDNGDGWEIERCLLSTLAGRAAGSRWLDAAASGASGFTDRGFVRALQIVKDLFDAKMFSTDINEAAYGTAMKDFTSGKAPYMIDGSWAVPVLANRLTASQKDYVSIGIFPSIGSEKSPGATSMAAGPGYAINARLTDDKAALAWKWIWHYAGPKGSRLRLSNGEIPSYVPGIDTRDADQLVRKLAMLVDAVPGCKVLDSVMDPAGIDTVLSRLVKETMSGRIAPSDAAREYEDWVSANDSNRKRK